MQNVHLGLPLLLLPEEATLMVEKGLATMVERDFTSLPTQLEVKDFNQMRANSYQTQITACRELRKQEMLRRRDDILAEKRKKRQKLVDEKPDLDQTQDTDDILEKGLDKEIDRIGSSTLQEKYSFVQIPTASPREGVTAPAKWTFPSSVREKLRYRVFKDLWEKGYFLTSAGKFGGDFLVYPGDPSRYHSFYIAVCLQYGESVAALDVITMGRLGSGVKKTILLCSIDDTDQLTYTSLQWTGIS